MKAYMNIKQRKLRAASKPGVIRCLKRVLLGGVAFACLGLFGCSFDGSGIAPEESVLLDLFPELGNKKLLDGLPTGTIGGLAYGDFDCDGRQDLALGDPDQPVDDVLKVGVVHLFYGNGDSDVIFAKQLGETAAKENDAFGFSVAVANFDNRGCFDLAIGAPGFDGNSEDVGRVYVVRDFKDTGLSVVNHTVMTLDGEQKKGYFGTALAVGNFNGDNYADLAVGIPKTKTEGHTDAGAVRVFHGNSTGLKLYKAFHQTDCGDGVLSTCVGGTNGEPEENDLFGFSLATGDFDGNGFDDLAIGVVGECKEDFLDLCSLTRGERGGAVNILYGLPGGLSEIKGRIWSQASDSVKGGIENYDAFGFTLAAGDFDGDGYKDLAIGVPGESTVGNTIKQAGAVNVLYGGPEGLQADEDKGASQNDQIWGQNNTPNTPIGDIPGEAAVKNYFGAALATGNLNGDRYDELAVGVIQYDVDGKIAGAVNILLGSATGLVAEGSQLLSQASPGVNSEDPQTDDYFGTALVMGDVDGNRIDELAVRVNDGEDCAAHVFYGVEAEPVDDDELFQCSVGELLTFPGGIVTDDPPPRTPFDGTLEPMATQPIAPTLVLEPGPKGELLSKTPSNAGTDTDVTQRGLEADSGAGDGSEMLFAPVDVGAEDDPGDSGY